MIPLSFILIVFVLIAPNWGQEDFSGKDWCALKCGTYTPIPCKQKDKYCLPTSCKDPIGNDPEKLKSFRLMTMDALNSLRSLTANGKLGKFPPASAMMTLSYDFEMEYLARCLACKLCKDRNDMQPCYITSKFPKYVKGFGKVQQTGPHAFEIRDFTVALPQSIRRKYGLITDEAQIKKIVNELVFSISTSNFMLQPMMDVSTHVGCAVKICGANAHAYACIMGPLVTTGNPLYKQGEHCSECPTEHKCSERYPGLCGKSMLGNVEMYLPRRCTPPKH